MNVFIHLYAISNACTNNFWCTLISFKTKCTDKLLAKSQYILWRMIHSFFSNYKYSQNFWKLVVLFKYIVITTRFEMLYKHKEFWHPTKCHLGVMTLKKVSYFLHQVIVHFMNGWRKKAYSTLSKLERFGNIKSTFDGLINWFTD